MHDVIKTFRAAQDFPTQGVTAYSRIQGVDWSDHSSFWKNGYSALMVTDTAIFRYPFYHSSNDTADKLDYIKMAKVFTGLHAVISNLASSQVKN